LSESKPRPAGIFRAATRLSMKNKLKYIVPLAVVLLIAGLVLQRASSGSAASTLRRAPVPAVKLTNPTRETITRSVRYTGNIEAIQQAAIYSKVTGNIDELYVNIGMPVRTGQLLALIDTTELAQQVEQSAATYQNAKLQFERTRDLFEKNLTAQADRDNAQAALTIAKANYDNSITRLGYTRITAPFAGVVTKRFLDPGAVVSPNTTTLFTLMDLDSVRVFVNVLEKDIPQIVHGTRAVVSVDAFPGREFNGIVTRSADAVDPATRTMAVEIDIPNKDHALKPGMFSNVTLIIGEKTDALTLPTQAVLKDSSGSYIFTVVADTARRLSVRTGADQNNRTEIVSGLTESQPVVVQGQQFVRNGGPVSIQK
jgi:membrane fusion protein, multidrug efflux system